MGLLVPALIALLRMLVLRYTLLGQLSHGFIPLAGPIDGIWPHPFYCAMHDLSHPLLLLVYCAVFAWLPLRTRAHTRNGHPNLMLFCGLLLLHAAFVLSFCASVFLPVGDMVTTIKP
jgi:hypothetical protein